MLKKYYIIKRLCFIFLLGLVACGENEQNTTPKAGVAVRDFDIAGIKLGMYVSEMKKVLKEGTFMGVEPSWKRYNSFDKYKGLNTYLEIQKDKARMHIDVAPSPVSRKQTTTFVAFKIKYSMPYTDENRVAFEKRLKEKYPRPQNIRKSLHSNREEWVWCERKSTQSNSTNSTDECLGAYMVYATKSDLTLEIVDLSYIKKLEVFLKQEKENKLKTTPDF